MNINIAKGHCQRLKGALVARWGILTGNRLRVAAGRHQQIAGRLHIAYGIAQRELARQIMTVERRSRERRATS
jgi:uncharacterized protein YjbJ (UPF0337 family)